MKKVGEVYEIKELRAECPNCGKKVEQEYIARRNKGQLDFDKTIGFCKCGNIFLVKYE